jgi:Tol biopolymer transport system component
MNAGPDIERLLADWMASAAPSDAPRLTVEDAISATSRRRPRPAWLANMRTPPMTTPRTTLVGSPTWRVVYLLTITAFSLALAAGSIAAGASLVAQATDDPIEPAPPTGLARNGLIAFSHEGDIWVIEPDGSDPRPFVATPQVDGPAVWSPDGTRLAFWSFTFEGDATNEAEVEAAMRDPDPNMSVNVVRADGTDHQVLLSGVKWASPCGIDLSWAHDSERLAVSFGSRPSGKDVAVIEILSLDGEAPRRVAGHGVDPSWAPDDRTIAYHSVANPNTLELVNSDGSGEATRLTEVSGSGCAFDGSTWSPDGSRVAFYAGSDGSHDVWVTDVDGSADVRLSMHPADEYWPRWSPDGTRIAFDRVVTSSAPQFVVSDPDGGDQVLLEHPLVGSAPIWSPDGRTILGVSLTEDRSGMAGLLLVDPAGVAAPVEIFQGVVLDPTWQRLAP